MRTRAIFERKVGLFPKDMKDLKKANTIETLLLNKVKETLEGRCSQHGWVIPGTLKILSRSMCQNESGRFTGAMVSWVQVEGEVYYPSDKMEIIGEVLKKNKMGLFVSFENAIQIMVPRDLHLGNEEYEAVEIGNYVRLEIKKSRFQVNDKFILSVGEFKEVVEAPAQPPAVRVETVAPVAEAAEAAEENNVDYAVSAASATAAAAAPPPMMPPQQLPLSAIAEEDNGEEGVLGAEEEEAPAGAAAAKGASIGDFFQ